MMSVSVKRLAAVPSPVCASVEAPVSPVERLPVRTRLTTSVCGSAGSERSVTFGCESGPVMLATTV